MLKNIKTWKLKKTGVNSSAFLALFAIVTFAAYIFFLNDAFAETISLPIGGGSIFMVFAPNPIFNGGGHFDPGDTPTGGTMCAIVGMMNSGIVRSLSALAVIFLGIGALFGQVKWTQALMLGVGIALMLGASAMVASMPSYKASDTDIAVKGIDATFSGGEVQTCN